MTFTFLLIFQPGDKKTVQEELTAEYNDHRLVSAYPNRGVNRLLLAQEAAVHDATVVSRSKLEVVD